MSTNTKDTPIELIPPAFHILWEAALIDKRLLSSEALIPLPETPIRFRFGQNYNKSRQQRLRSVSESSATISASSSTSSMSSPTPSRKTSHPRNDPTIIPKKNLELDMNRQHSFDLSNEIASIYAKETAAVCIMECERGEKLVRKSFYDMKGRHGRVKTEDYLLDWLAADLISQHARAVDLTVYLSCPPMSTTSDGLILWIKNLTEEGKEVTLSVKLASLGFLHPCYTRPGVQEVSNANEEPEEREETLLGLQRLQDAGVAIVAVTPREWPELLTLLADKMALRHLEDSHTYSNNHLQGLLQGVVDNQ